MRPAEHVISWVVGRGGLLGKCVDLSLSKRGAIWHPLFDFTWGDPQVVHKEFAVACLKFGDVVGDLPWQIVWCAGAGVVGSESLDLEIETLAFESLLSAIEVTLCRKGRARGAVFLASSAGGVYAGSKNAPFDEDSSVAPLSPYGFNKLKQESIARIWSLKTSTPLLVGRISNLYGPGQDPSKHQGLITQLCWRSVARRPLNIYVPLDTTRDYLFASDAGCRIANGLERLRLDGSEVNRVPIIVKIIASQNPLTIAAILAQFRWIMKRPAQVVIGTSPIASRQPRDLRMISNVWRELDQGPITTISAGIKSVLDHAIRTSGDGRLTINEMS